jgi:predicted nucleic acid-binding protein
VGFLIDTNVLAELRKGERGDPGVQAWYASISSTDIHISVIVLGEIRRGAELLRRRDPIAAARLEGWLTMLRTSVGNRLLPITVKVAYATHEPPLPPRGGGVGGEGNGHDFHDWGVPGKVMTVCQEVADRWGHLGIPDPFPIADGLLAATALVHDLVLVTRNTRDVERSGVKMLNPFSSR